MPDIVLRGVDKIYGKGPQKAVSQLDLEVEDGDFMCLLGPSGCGKTTTLRMIAGLENLTAGEISVDGKVLDSISAGIFVPPENRRMGLVFQSYALWPHLTVARNTDFGLRLRGVSKEERQSRVDHVMKTLGIEPYRDRYPSELSGGQQQRVALARMLVVNPEILLLDEPLSNLDARLRLEMRTELKRIHSEFGTTVVFVTHDQWEAMTLATSIAVMHEGALQQIGTPDEIYDRPANRFVAEFVGSPPINIIEYGEVGPGELSRLAQAFAGKRLTSSNPSGSLGIRPEAIHVTAPEDVPSGQVFTGPATVTAVLPTGGSWIVELNAMGTPIFATSNRPPLQAVGQDVQFQVEQASVHLFGGDGARLDFGSEATRRAAS